MKPSSSPNPQQTHLDRAVTPKIERKLELLRHQIEITRGDVSQGIFVSKPGVQLIADTRPNDLGTTLLDEMNIDTTLSPAEQLAELFSRQTYFTFLSQTGDGAALLQRVIGEAGHRSVTKSDIPVHLFAGVSVAAAIDIVRAGGAIGRLTTSNTGKTHAMDETLYRVYGEGEERVWQENALRRFIALRGQLEQEFSPRTLSEDGNELLNMFNLQSKTLALLQSMNLKAHHSTFSSWLGGRESSPEIVELGERMVDELSALHPNIIYPADRYRALDRSRDANENIQALEDSILRDGGVIEEGTFVTKPGCAISWPHKAMLEQLSKEESSLDPNLVVIEFQLSGIAFETIMELVSHSEATVAGLRSFSEPYKESALYRIQGDESEQRWQKEGIKRFLELRNEVIAEREQGASTDSLSQDSRYALERFDLGTRAEMLRYGMRLSDFHKFFIGRLSHSGNELEIQELAGKMCEQLHALFPSHIHSPAEYYTLGNDSKY